MTGNRRPGLKDGDGLLALHRDPVPEGHEWRVARALPWPSQITCAVAFHLRADGKGYGEARQRPGSPPAISILRGRLEIGVAVTGEVCRGDVSKQSLPDAACRCRCSGTGIERLQTAAGVATDDAGRGREKLSTRGSRTGMDALPIGRRPMVRDAGSAYYDAA